MTRLTRFYLGLEPDDRGRLVTRIQSFDEDRLEETHDFIQWLFPLPEPSPVNPGAPVLDETTIAEFQSRPELREALLRSLHMMIRFYGFELHLQPLPVVVRAEGFEAAIRNWLTPGNHNHLRLTRILRSTRLLGLETESRAFFRALEALYQSERGRENITAATFRYWRSAAG